LNPYQREWVQTYFQYLLASLPAIELTITPAWRILSKEGAISPTKYAVISLKVNSTLKIN